MIDRKDFQSMDEEPLAGLAPEATPPPALEDRVVAALRERGLLRNRSRRRGWILSAAAALAIFAAGVAVGRRPATGAAAAQARFVLFLEPLPEELRGDSSHEAERVSEYRAWAERLRTSGRAISGEKLRTGARVIATGSGAKSDSALDDVGGFFVVSARDIEEAVGIARECPHARHGGRIVVRAIEPT